MARPAWSGFIRLSLVAVPVKAFSAEAPEGRDLAFHQLHKKCHSRIRYKKVCPIHGEVSAHEITSAYEYQKGKYIELDDEDLDRKKTRDRGIAIEHFIPPTLIDPLMFEGSGYYLMPDGDTGAEPYALLRQAMLEQDRWALAQAVLWRKDRLVLIRPYENLLTMSLLRFSDQLREPTDFADEFASGKGKTAKGNAVKSKATELRLAKRLIAETSVERIDWSDYADEYRKKITHVVERKIAGEETIEVESDDDAPVINLMDALKKSMAGTKRSSGKRKSTRKTGPQQVSIRIPHAASRKTKGKAKSKPKAKSPATKKRKVS